VTKDLLDREADMDLSQALELESAEQARLMQSADFKEGYRAFVEKRPAKFNRS
jgi:enoyl-CoA hydratase/carnithine racemase